MLKPIIRMMGFFLLSASSNETMAEHDAYLTVEDVAKRFGVTPSTVYRLAQRGVLPGFKVGVQWRFSPDMLESWVADQVMAERLRAEDRKDSPGKA